MSLADKHWQVDSEFAEKYSSSLDRQLFCDRPLLDLLGTVSGKAVLDIGCGNGQISREVAKRAGKVIGIDASEEMLEQAKRLHKDVDNIEFIHASAEQLPFSDGEFDAALCSMTIITFPTVEMIKGMFKEAARVLKPSGILSISWSNIYALGKKSKFRWTEWEQGQTLQNLVPGEALTRKFLNKNGQVLEVVNYYWPPEILVNIANRYHLTHEITLEPKASKQELEQYPKELDATLGETSFFMIAAFRKALE